MGMAFRLMLYLLLFNLAVGLLFWIGTNDTVGGRDWKADGTNQNRFVDQTSQLNSQFNASTTIPAQSAQNFWYRFLDIISLGLFTQIQTILQSTIYALPALLVGLGIIPNGLMIFVNGVLTIIYIVGVMELMSGKDISLR